MCLIVFSFQQHPQRPLVFAANRDEFRRRPTAPATFWKPERRVLAGRDLQDGGTWFGVTREGRWAAVTNVREPTVRAARSRGALPASYLTGAESPDTYAARIAGEGASYAGFNLLIGDRSTCWFVSNRGGPPRALVPGLYGLSNATLDTPWPKVRRAKMGIASEMAALLEDDAVDHESLLNLLTDETRAPSNELPDTGVDATLEHALSPLFIRLPEYGTRSSSVLTLNAAGRAQFTERTWPENGAAETRRFGFEVMQPVRRVG